jgi:hypothetical protein
MPVFWCEEWINTRCFCCLFVNLGFCRINVFSLWNASTIQNTGLTVIVTFLSWKPSKSIIGSPTDSLKEFQHMQPSLESYTSDCRNCSQTFFFSSFNKLNNSSFSRIYNSYLWFRKNLTCRMSNSEVALTGRNREHGTFIATAPSKNCKTKQHHTICWSWILYGKILPKFSRP